MLGFCIGSHRFQEVVRSLFALSGYGDFVLLERVCKMAFVKRLRRIFGAGRGVTCVAIEEITARVELKACANDTARLTECIL